MLRYQTQGVLALGLGLVVGGCFGDPTIRTDLRPEGPPEILVGMGQSVITSEELPFHCRYVSGIRDPKTPSFVIDAILGGQIVCPDEVADFTANDIDPRGFAIRVMFDELLDPDRVETLDCDDEGACVGSLATTQPVTFTCGTTATAVDYDGYYVPNGNATTFPLGPSLLLQPDPASLTFPTGTSCTVTMGANVIDKSGNAVPSTENNVDFKIADLALLSVSPEDAEDVDDRAVLGGYDPIAYSFNAAMDDASVSATDVVVTDSANANQVIDVIAFDFNDFGVDETLLVVGDPYFLPGTFTAKIAMGASLTEANGGTIVFTADEPVRFSVTYGVVETVPADGDDHMAAADIEIILNGALDAATVTAAELSLATAAGTAVPFAFSQAADTITINPTATLAAGDYVLTINATASFGGPGAFAADFEDDFEVGFTVP